LLALLLLLLLLFFCCSSAVVLVIANRHQQGGKREMGDTGIAGHCGKRQEAKLLAIPGQGEMDVHA
jgi:hypothetical protein